MVIYTTVMSLMKKVTVKMTLNGKFWFSTYANKHFAINFQANQ